MMYDLRTGYDGVNAIWPGKAKQFVSTVTKAIWSLFTDIWGGAANPGAYVPPVVASTIDSKHIRMWHYDKNGKARFGGYSKR